MNRRELHELESELTGIKDNGMLFIKDAKTYYKGSLEAIRQRDVVIGFCERLIEELKNRV